MLNLALAGALEEEGPGKGDGGRRRRRMTETTRRRRGDDEETTETTARTEKPLTHADRVGGLYNIALASDSIAWRHIVLADNVLA